jgi:large subunit ribosomal protein L24
MHVKIKDTVLVLSGKDAGRQGTVLAVDHDRQRALVERVNVVKKHAKANPRKGVKAGILEREAPVHVSNLMVVCPRCGKPTRVRTDRTGERRVRACSREGCRAAFES